MQKSTKILRAVNREKMLRTDGRTNGLTDKHEFIGPPQAVQKLQIMKKTYAKKMKLIKDKSTKINKTIKL